MDRPIVVQHVLAHDPQRKHVPKMLRLMNESISKNLPARIEHKIRRERTGVHRDREQEQTTGDDGGATWVSGGESVGRLGGKRLWGIHRPRFRRVCERPLMSLNRTM